MSAYTYHVCVWVGSLLTLLRHAPLENCRTHMTEASNVCEMINFPRQQFWHTFSDRLLQNCVLQTICSRSAMRWEKWGSEHESEMCMWGVTWRGQSECVLERSNKSKWAVIDGDRSQWCQIVLRLKMTILTQSTMGYYTLVGEVLSIMAQQLEAYRSDTPTHIHRPRSVCSYHGQSKFSGWAEKKEI